MKIKQFDFFKLVNDKAVRETMISGKLKTKEVNVLDDLEDYGPDKFFEIVHQSENMLIMKNKFKVVLNQYLIQKHACSSALETLSISTEIK
jgi:hypothetical protein